MSPKYDTSSFRDLPGLLPDHIIRDKCVINPGEVRPEDWLPMIEPFAEGEKRPGVISYGLTSIGYDIRIGWKFKIFSSAFGGIVSPKKLDPRCFIDHEVDPDGPTNVMIVPGNGYILGESVEFFRIPRDIGCIVLGKSTFARCGITINVTPGEPEWEGRWTVEIENAGPCPAEIYCGEGIAQVLFVRTVTECDKSYKDKGGKYQGDQGLRLPVVDRIYAGKCGYCNGFGYIASRPYTVGDRIPVSDACNHCNGSGFIKEQK